MLGTDAVVQITGQDTFLHDIGFLAFHTLTSKFTAPRLKAMVPSSTTLICSSHTFFPKGRRKWKYVYG